MCTNLIMEKCRKLLLLFAKCKNPLLKSKCKNSQANAGSIIFRLRKLSYKIPRLQIWVLPSRQLTNAHFEVWIVQSKLIEVRTVHIHRMLHFDQINTLSRWFENLKNVKQACVSLRPVLYTRVYKTGNVGVYKTGIPACTKRGLLKIT